MALVGILWYNAIEYQIKEAKKLAAAMNPELTALSPKIPKAKSVDVDIQVCFIGFGKMIG